MCNSNNRKPLVSVIMGIYNCEETLREAVECIVNQTYPYWELIMCDDGSTDDTYSIAEELRDKYKDRIILLKNKSNKGLNHTLNKCLKMSKGEYIARMDGDDLCSPERFYEELKVFSEEPEISIVSTDMEFFDDSGTFGIISNPDYPKKEDFLKGTPFCHAPCMVKREAYISVGGYTEDKRLLRVEDYHLWVKMYAAGYIGKNIHKSLYQMRDDQNAYKRRKYKYRINAAFVTVLMLKAFNYSYRYYYLALVPLIKGLLPKYIYLKLHKKRVNKYN